MFAIAALAGASWVLTSEKTQKVVTEDPEVDDARELPTDLYTDNVLLSEVGLANIPNLFETGSKKATEKFEDHVRSRMAIRRSIRGASSAVGAETLAETIFDDGAVKIHTNVL